MQMNASRHGLCSTDVQSNCVFHATTCTQREQREKGKDRARDLVARLICWCRCCTFYFASVVLVVRLVGAWGVRRVTSPPAGEDRLRMQVSCLKEISSTAVPLPVARRTSPTKGSKPRGYLVNILLVGAPILCCPRRSLIFLVELFSFASLSRSPVSPSLLFFSYSFSLSPPSYFFVYVFCFPHLLLYVLDACFG